MHSKEYVAFDLGASSGRTMLGQFDGDRLAISEISRFENVYTRLKDGYYWDALHLYNSMQDGLSRYAGQYTGRLSGIGVDTWGVDFGLIDSQGKLIGNPRAYRDPRGLKGMTAFHEKYGDRAAFDITGIANMEFNSLYRLYDMVQTNDPQLEIADKLLLLPDLLGYLLCGGVSSEYTQATTTQMLDSRTKGWSERLLKMAGLQRSLFPDVRMSGDIKGELFEHIKEAAGLHNRPPVYAVGSHDTASAIAAVPAADDDYAFLSSGTWSLLGIVSDQAMLCDDAYALRFSSEGTVDGRYCPLRNIMGLWIIQNCKRQWDRERQTGWDDIVRMAKAATAFRSFIDVDAHVFYEADNMPLNIQRYCRDTGQAVPLTQGEVARTVYESLAMSCREAFAGLEQMKGGRIGVLHIVGGGSKNRLLNQFMADALNREVVAGPAEATAIGNLMVQLRASGEVRETDLRRVIRGSFDVENYGPKDTDAWSDRFESYQRIKERYHG